MKRRSKHDYSLEFQRKFGHNPNNETNPLMREHMAKYYGVGGQNHNMHQNMLL